MHRIDIMDAEFLFQIFLKAQGIFKTKYDFHCQEKLLLSYCSLLFAGGSGRGVVEGYKLWLPPALLMFLRNMVGKDLIKIHWEIQLLRGQIVWPLLHENEDMD